MHAEWQTMQILTRLSHSTAYDNNCPCVANIDRLISDLKLIQCFGHFLNDSTFINRINVSLSVIGTRCNFAV